MGFTAFISRILGLGRKWGGSPEQFLAMAQYMAKKNNPEYSAADVFQWGEVLQKVMKVDLRPYANFGELLERGVPDYSIVEKVDSKFTEVQHRRELKQAIYGKNADLGDDDVMNGSAKDAVFARKMVKDLSEYVKFSDEDQWNIDEMKNWYS